MTSSSPMLLELARRYGVAAEFDDWTGRRTAVAESTLVAVLEALGVPAGTEQERVDALAAHDRQYWQRRLPPIVLGRAGMPTSFWVHVTHGDPAHLTLLLEDGTERGGLRQLENNRPPYDLGDRLIGEATFELPVDLPLGYHRLRLNGTDIEAPVVISPATVGLPTRLGERRAWGLRSRRCRRRDPRRPRTPGPGAHPRRPRGTRRSCRRRRWSGRRRHRRRRRPAARPGRRGGHGPARSPRPGPTRRCWTTPAARRR